MRRINLLSLTLMFFVHCYLFCSVACILTMTVMSHTNLIDLGFNNVIEDLCDYRDYSNADFLSKFNGLTILQHNIRGVLRKQDPLKLLLNDIR